MYRCEQWTPKADISPYGWPEDRREVLRIYPSISCAKTKNPLSYPLKGLKKRDIGDTHPYPGIPCGVSEVVL
jgi:hypothetical protein